MPATLSLVDLKLPCHLGVPDAERRKTQTVLCTAVFTVPSLSRAAAGATEFVCAAFACQQTKPSESAPKQIFLRNTSK